MEHTILRKALGSFMLLLAAFVLFVSFAPVVSTPVQAQATLDDPCADENDPNSLIYAMNQASVAYQTAAMTAVDQGYRQMPLSNLQDCINRIQGYFQNIQGILLAFSADGLANALLALFSSIITAMCDYVIQSINNALNSICIPVPDLGSFSLSLPRLQANSCNGISLGTMMGIGSGGNGFPSSLPQAQINGISLGAELLMRRR